MKTMVISEFNTDPAPHDVPAPEPGDGEVLVDVEFASLNGMDIATWSGAVRSMMPFELPITLGRDFSGTVSAAGSGVTGLAVGDAVFGTLLKMPLHDGTFAEQAAAPMMTVARRPYGLDSKTAAALAWAGNAAKAAVDALAPAAGETVLVSGATGGVGAIAVQLAKQRGAFVIGTATHDRAAFVRDLGADDTVDHTGDLAAAVRRLRPRGVDAVLHAAGHGVALADLVAPGGRLASLLGVGPEQVEGRDMQATRVMSIPGSESLSELAALAADGRLRVPIAKTYSLDEVPQAIKHFVSGKTGKLVVAVR